MRVWLPAMTCLRKPAKLPGPAEPTSSQVVVPQRRASWSASTLMEVPPQYTWAWKSMLPGMTRHPVTSRSARPRSPGPTAATLPPAERNIRHFVPPAAGVHHAAVAQDEVVVHRRGFPRESQTLRRGREQRKGAARLPDRPFSHPCRRVLSPRGWSGLPDPFCPCPTTTRTDWPSVKGGLPARSSAVACTNTSLPPSCGEMKPKPLFGSYHFTVPVISTPGPVSICGRGGRGRAEAGPPRHRRRRHTRRAAGRLAAAGVLDAVLSSTASTCSTCRPFWPWPTRNLQGRTLADLLDARSL